MINSYKIYFLIFKLLNLSNKFYLLLFLTLIATAFEVMSIGSLLPLLQVMVNENALDQYGNIKSILLTLSPLKLFGQMQNYEHLNFVASISTVILILFILKFLYLVFFEWYKAKFLHELEFKLSNRIFKGYILSPYSYHTQKNTSEFHRDIQSDVNYFIGSSASVATLVTEIFVVIGLAGLILSVEFQSSILGLFTVLIFGMLFIKVTSSFNSRLGSKVHSSMQLRIKNFIHGLEGIKEVICNISGNNVFSRLKFESGVHRVQRVPTTESSGRVHTSAATIAVLPEAEEIDINLEDKDLRIDVFRSSGPGGQSVNTTDSAVRITHIPSGLVVSQQDEKSQHKNKAKALKILRSRLLDFEIQQKNKKRSEERKTQVGSGDRSERIRTYNFPQGRVSDHRINLTLYNLSEILEGNLDDLIEPLIADQESKKLADINNE